MKVSLNTYLTLFPFTIPTIKATASATSHRKRADSNILISFIPFLKIPLKIPIKTPMTDGTVNSMNTGPNKTPQYNRIFPPIIVSVKSAGDE